RAGRWEGDEHAARARRRNGTPARRPPRERGRGLRLAGRHPRGHAARLHEPLADPQRPLPLGTGKGVAAHDEWRSSGRARRGRRSGGGRGGAGGGGGGGAQPLTNEPLGARAPAPLADGTLLYAALRARGWELRRVSALEGARPVTFAKPLPFDPAPAVPI